jgi:hypothetical protein
MLEIKYLEKQQLDGISSFNGNWVMDFVYEIKRFTPSGLLGLMGQRLRDFFRNLTCYDKHADTDQLQSK